jgi:AcrR family transcriptional regulator
VSVVADGATPSAARPDRRAARRQATRDEIVAAAWDLVREHGLAGLAMRDLGERVGMRAQSIYSYFASKHEIYDAMFHEGYLAFAAAMPDADELPEGDVGDPVVVRAHARAVTHRFFEFCTSDPVRYQLLFQRTIPDFVPSEASYAIAVECLGAMQAQLAAFGIVDAAAVDLWTAVLTGLTDQQISNDPGGNRWARLIDRAVDMALRETAPHLFDTTEART